MAPKEHKEQTLAFHHQDDAWKVDIKSEMDSTYDYGYVGDADLGEYLARPIEIFSTNWTVTSGSFDNTINPWKLFVENTQVRNRIEGYKLLQGKMHIRVTINGNPFLYGRAMASYFPRAAKNEFFEPSDATLVTMQESMRPHIFIDPTSSEGGEMVLPFFCPDNWIDLTGGTADLMGTLRIRSFNNLLHANAATGTAQITVFAWMDNVKLAGPTQASYGTYIAQSGDEYGQGIVSRPASIVAKVAGYLSEVPVLGAYARATELAATSVGRVASLFGLSRPNIVSDLVRHKHFATGNLANTDQHEAVTKLTLDSKQELCIDPRTVGLADVDEMAMKYIVGKEVFLGTATWTEANTKGTLIRRINVSPIQHNYVANLPNEVLYAPMATVAAAFKYWRGTIKFRVQIVASAMHRGRLRITYDPTLPGASTGFNENYTRIIDLATNRDFNFDVGWNSHRSWLECDADILNGPSTEPNHNATSSNLLYHNGSFRIEVLNTLSSPDPSLGQEVYLNIYASAGDDFELAAPTSAFINGYEYLAQDGFEAQAGNENEELIEDADNQPETGNSQIVSAGDQKLVDATGHVYFGEHFCSIRALLKRYNFHSALGSGTTGFWWQEYNFPYYPGEWNALNRHQDDALVAVNFSNMTYLNWFTPCYAGWRGGLRSKYYAPGASLLSVRREGPVSGSSIEVVGVTLSTSNESEIADEARRLYWGGHGGLHNIHTDTDGGAEIEFPFYSYKRFAHGRMFPIGSASNLDQGHVDAHTGIVSALDSGTPGIFRYVAAGDDYSTFFWIGQPVLTYNNGGLISTSGNNLPFRPVT